MLLEFNKQSNLIDKAEFYEKERNSILNENIEIDYSNKLKFETEKIENKYRKKIYKLEEEKSFLSKLVITF